MFDLTVAPEVILLIQERMAGRPTPQIVRIEKVDGYTIRLDLADGTAWDVSVRRVR